MLLWCAGGRCRGRVGVPQRAVHGLADAACQSTVIELRLSVTTPASPASTAPSAAHASGMAAASTPDELRAATPVGPQRERERIAHNGKPAEQDSDSDEDGDEDGDEADEEPKLKYTRLTSSLAPVYRNGDATSTFLVAGDKMVGRMLSKLPDRAPAEP